MTDAGPLLTRLHALTRADCTTRNQAKAQRLARAYDSLEERIAALAEREELAAIRPDLDGNDIMAILGIPPGPLVGQAHAHLRELRMEHGPLGRERAVQELLGWAAEAGRSGRRGTRGRAGRAGRGSRPPGRLTTDQPVAAGGEHVAHADDQQHGVRVAGARHEQRAARRAGHEGAVEEHVVQGEDPAAEIVVHFLLEGGGGADGDALGDDAEQEADHQEARLVEAGPEGHGRDAAAGQQDGDPGRLLSRRVATGVTTAATPYPIADATTMTR